MSSRTASQAAHHLVAVSYRGALGGSLLKQQTRFQVHMRLQQAAPTAAPSSPAPHAHLFDFSAPLSSCPAAAQICPCVYVQICKTHEDSSVPSVQVDLMLVVDMSSSVTEGGTAGWQNLIAGLNTILDNLPVGENETRLVDVLAAVLMCAHVCACKYI